MTLLNPLGLLGLLSLPIIVVFHLLFERDRKVVVSSLYLWSFLEKKLQGLRPRSLRITWLLVLDLLIAALVSLAWAQPQIDISSPLGQDTQRIILLDISTSMLAKDISPSRFSIAKQETIDIIETLVGDEDAAVIRVGRGVELVGDTRTVLPEVLVARVNELAAGSTGVDFGKALSLADSIADDNRPVELHIITDGAFELNSLEDLPTTIRWHFIGRAGNNQAVTDLELVEISPNEYQLFAELVNFSVEEREQEVRTMVDGEEVRRSVLSLPPLSAVPYVVTLIGEMDQVRVELTRGDALAEDNFAVLSNNPPYSIQAALVTNFPEPLERAIGAVPNVDLDVINPDDYASTSSYDVTFFRGYLPERWPAGVVVVIDPPQDSELVEVDGVRDTNERLEIIPGQLTDGLIFSGVRLKGAWGISGWEEVFSTNILSGDSPLLLTSTSDNGKLILFLPVLELSNLTTHPVFPLITSNFLDFARKFSPEGQYLIGEALNIPSDHEYDQLTIYDPLGQEIPIPKAGVVSLNLFGEYTLNYKDAFGVLGTLSFGVNAGDGAESDVRPREWVEDIGAIEPEAGDDPRLKIDLSPWLLAGSVLLLFVEVWRAWR